MATLHQAPKLHHDTALWFFGIAALLTLFVSIPATFALLSPFHDGWWLALFAMLVFELGAVGAKLITIAIPKWRGRLTALTLALLVLTTIGNALHGAELFSAAVLPPVLAQLRADGHGPWLVAGSAALFPALLFIWLFAFTARIEQLVSPPVNPLVASLQAELIETRQQLMQMVPPNDVSVTVNNLIAPRAELEYQPNTELRRIVDTATGTARSRYDTSGYVYVLATDQGTHKIGMAIDVESRVKEIRGFVPFAVDVVLTIATDNRRILERRLHECFADRRIRAEWFALTESDIDALHSLGDTLQSEDIDETIDLFSVMINLPSTIEIPVKDELPEIVRLKDVDKLTFAQIGDQLGVTRQAAWQQYKAAKKS